ncbi:hypothetical protein B9Q00_10570 [Candidatus Marsarchaeota G1 archaeon OSP_C]|jgi:Protein of unknown function (DUF1059).|uniref:DUF1059 domain-containing protein n=1 Tax=Candidatus Marsarchaeota G1 archaeon OSP_C TaxID=1978154 RepID=A0A2R6AIF1_9ARCH|nr:MAG: hypothetical protein B9Q00_10570 [Candidatus Marsarchaeota G1 archaeon OSP_C]
MGYKVELKQVCGCDVSYHTKTKDELLSQVKQHAKQVHGISEVPQDLANKCGR